jgi:hypothetical protein
MPANKAGGDGLSSEAVCEDKLNSALATAEH